MNTLFVIKLQGAMCDSFMNMQMFFTPRTCAISGFQTDAVSHLLRSWKEKTGQQWYSLYLQVATSQLILTDAMLRLHSAVFTANQVFSQ